MNVSRLLSDLSWYALGLGLVTLLYGMMWRKRPGGPDPNDPDPHKRSMAAYKRAMETAARPLLIGGASLLVLALIFLITSRFVL